MVNLFFIPGDVSQRGWGAGKRGQGELKWFRYYDAVVSTSTTSFLSCTATQRSTQGSAIASISTSSNAAIQNQLLGFSHPGRSIWCLKLVRWRWIPFDTWESARRRLLYFIGCRNHGRHVKRSLYSNMSMFRFATAMWFGLSFRIQYTVDRRQKGRYCHFNGFTSRLCGSPILSNQ